MEKTELAIGAAQFMLWTKKKKHLDKMITSG